VKIVLEEIYGPVHHRPYIALFFGIFFTLISFIIAKIFFFSYMSVAMIFLITLLLAPVMVMLLKKTESGERKEGIKHFFRNHKEIFEVYLFSFLGCFLAFVAIGLLLYNSNIYASVFGFQNDFLHTDQGISADNMKSLLDTGVHPNVAQFSGLFSKNLTVVLVCFVLSFFYGASAMFLVILNGSIFANFIVMFIRTIVSDAALGIIALLLFMVHMLPEISGFLVAAIAGGIVSKAIMFETRGTKEFRNVFKDATFLMLISILLVLIGALLEVFVTARLFQIVF
jgi:uncharacterized membrane protein SpoIIM required for sporulation